MEQNTGAYTLDGVADENTVKVTYLGQTEKVTDTLTQTFDITDNIIGEIYKCNISNHYLMSSKKQPMFYLLVRWIKYIQRPIFYIITVNFTIESDIKSSDELLSNKHSGTYSIDVSIGNKKRELDKKIDKYPGDDNLITMLKGLTTSDEMVTIFKTLVDAEEAKRAALYAQNFERFVNVPKPTISLKDIKLD